MKKLKINRKGSGLWVKGMMALSLVFVLQGFIKCVGGIEDPITNFITHGTNPKDLPSRLKGLKIGAIADRINDILYDLVNRKESEKLKQVLKFCNNNQSTPELNASFIQALNALYGKNKKTLLGISINKGNIATFKLLMEQAGLDFNKAGDEKGKNPTSLLSALANEQRDMVNTLLEKPNIDIKTIDPISGNTTVHLAIINKWKDEAQQLIAKLKDEKALAVLFAQNKEGNTPLHLAMEYKLSEVQKALIELVAKEEENKLWIKNNKGNNVVYVAINNDQVLGINLIDRLSLEELLETNKKGKTLLHKAAHKNHLNAFKKILAQIIKLSGTGQVVKQLLEKDKDGKSVWQYIYLSEGGIEPAFSNTNITMFNDTITIVKDNLKAMGQRAILDEINNTATISKKYADKLRKIVNDATPA